MPASLLGGQVALRCCLRCRLACPVTLPTAPLWAGTPAKPLISQAAGSDAATASITIGKAFTATKYTVTLEDVNTPTNKDSQTFTVADDEAGPWTRTLNAPAKGTYRFKVRCWLRVWRTARCRM